MQNKWLSIAALASIGALPACVGSSPTPPTQGFNGISRAMLSPPVSKQYLYGIVNNSVIAYILGTKTIARTIRNGISSPNDLAVDSQGTVYVANSNNTVTEYDPGATTPSRTIRSGLNGPWRLLVVDNALYVLNIPKSSDVGFVAKYAVKGTSLQQRFGKSLRGILAFTADSFGTVYILGTLKTPGSNYSPVAIQEYDGTNVVARTINYQYPQYNPPAGPMAVSTQGALFVENAPEGQIAKYPRHSTTRAAVLKNMNLGLVTDLQFDASRTLYVEQTEGIVVYPAGSTKGTILAKYADEDARPASFAVESQGSQLFLLVGTAVNFARKGAKGPPVCAASAACNLTNVASDGSRKRLVSYNNATPTGPIRIGK